MNERIEASVSGRVQMVMYRDFTQRKASALGLTGYVKNLQDGTVEVVAEGARGALEKLIKKLHRGSIFAHVEDVRVTWLPATGEFQKFVIAYAQERER
ncbi:MAG: acylphosphatase [Parcubacteria group bacterium]|nr:acylphosphatase [Parcubacteria group bacterium]